MQYMVDVFSGEAKLAPLDVDRYPDISWTTLLDRFTSGHLPGAARGPRRP